MLRHYKIKKFAGESKKVNLSDYDLKASLDMFISLDDRGKQKYSLGAGLYKIRLATSEGRGKSSGSRSILAFREGDLLIWLHLFAKNDKGNVTKSELKKLKLLSDILLNLSDENMLKLLRSGELLEVKNDE